MGARAGVRFHEEGFRTQARGGLCAPSPPLALPLYMKAEVKRSKQAYQLASVSGYASVSELINLVEDGNTSRIPGITRVDI
jgi:hypothetical protein